MRYPHVVARFVNFKGFIIMRDEKNKPRGSGLWGQIEIRLEVHLLPCTMAGFMLSGVSAVVATGFGFNPLLGLWASPPL